MLRLAVSCGYVVRALQFAQPNACLCTTIWGHTVSETGGVQQSQHAHVSSIHWPRLAVFNHGGMAPVEGVASLQLEQDIMLPAREPRHAMMERQLGRGYDWLD